MMARVSDVVGHWLGLCRKPPKLRTSPSVFLVLPETADATQPDGGTSGSARFRRGMSAALSGTKTLARNKQLLWFPLMTGLVLAGLFLTQYMIRMLAVYFYDAMDIPRWIVLTFITELATVFCISILLAGLFLSLNHTNGTPLSFREGLARAKEHAKPLADWSVVIAFAGTLGFLVLYGFNYFTFPSMLYPAFSLFPFNFILLPEVYHIGPMGGTYAIAYGVTSTLILSAFNLLLFILTLFVVPVLVLEKKSLKEAVSRSVAMMKNVWGEMAACVLILGVVVIAASLISLLFRIVYGIVAPEMLYFWYPGDAWIVAALIYLLALCSLVFVGATVGGIASLDLYAYAKTGRMSGSAEPVKE